MKNLTVQVSDEFSKAVKMEALKQDMSLREFVMRLLEKALEQEKEKDDTQAR